MASSKGLRSLICCGEFLDLNPYVYEYIHTYIHTYICMYVCIPRRVVTLSKQFPLGSKTVNSLPSSWHARFFFFYSNAEDRNLKKC